jgi:hypothetical protein
MCRAKSSSFPHVHAVRYLYSVEESWGTDELAADVIAIVYE